VDQRYRSVLELAGSVALGVDVGNFLELKRAFERDRKARAATKIKNVARFGQILCKLFDLRFERERSSHQTRHLDQRPHKDLLIRLRHVSARTSGCNGKTS